MKILSPAQMLAWTALYHLLALMFILFLAFELSGRLMAVVLGACFMSWMAAGQLAAFITTYAPKQNNN
jgi:hypothetical protein